MKKLSILAALAAVAMTSCLKGQETADPNPEVKIVVKINGGEQTRAEGVAAGTALMPAISNPGMHWIYILDDANTVLHSEELDVTASQSTEGQEISGGDKFPIASKVYILANIPDNLSNGTSSITPAGLSDWNQIQAAQSAIVYGATMAAGRNVDYEHPAMANESGAAASLNPYDDYDANGNPTTAEANVGITPLYARIELAGVKGDKFVENFNVEAVYLDNYYSAFTMTGVGVGQLNKAGQQITFPADWFGDVYSTPLPATTGDRTTGTGVVAPTTGTDSRWVYHVGPGEFANFIVKLSGVTVFPADSSDPTTPDASAVAVTPISDSDENGNWWITTTGYTGENSTFKFQRGYIYEVSPIVFSGAGEGAVLADTPNPVGVSITAKVTVKPWNTYQITPKEIK